MQKILILLVGLLTTSWVQADSAALLVYKVWEKGAEPYFTRILVTPGHVRLDEGRGEGDFTLLDRKAGIIYNISHEDNSVLVLDPELEQVPESTGLILEAKKTPNEKAPTVGGVKPMNVELLANGESCGSVVAVAGLMDAAVQGLRELKQVLALVHAGTQAMQPDELQTACDLASNIQAPTRLLDHGLPLEEHSPGGVQLLIDYAETHEVGPGLFEVPAGLQSVRMPTLPAI